MGSLIDKDKLKVKAIEAITKNKLIFVEDVAAMCGINKTTLYDKFPIESNDYNDIKELLEQNKIDIKVSIRYKWSKSDNPTAQMALYKLCSNAEEHRKLQQNYTDVTSKNEQIQSIDPFAAMRANHGINEETEAGDTITNE